MTLSSCIRKRTVRACMCMWMCVRVRNILGGCLCCTSGSSLWQYLFSFTSWQIPDVERIRCFFLILFFSLSVLCSLLCLSPLLLCFLSICFLFLPSFFFSSLSLSLFLFQLFCFVLFFFFYLHFILLFLFFLWFSPSLFSIG